MSVAIMANMLGTKGQDTYKESVLSCPAIVTIRRTMGDNHFVVVAPASMGR